MDVRWHQPLLQSCHWRLPAHLPYSYLLESARRTVGSCLLRVRLLSIQTSDMSVVIFHIMNWSHLFAPPQLIVIKGTTSRLCIFWITIHDKTISPIESTVRPQVKDYFWSDGSQLLTWSPSWVAIHIWGRSFRREEPIHPRNSCGVSILIMNQDVKWKHKWHKPFPRKLLSLLLGVARPNWVGVHISSGHSFEA